MIYKVTVHPDHRWSDTQIAGRIFSKRADTYLNEVDVTDELRRATLEDEETGTPPILIIEAVGGEEQKADAKEVEAETQQAEGEQVEATADVEANEVLTRRRKRG